MNGNWKQNIELHSIYVKFTYPQRNPDKMSFKQALRWNNLGSTASFYFLYPDLSSCKGHY